jgi:GNAT superfamily N-acetyltransferase
VIEVRCAVAGDADAICDAHVAAWRVAYREAFPPSYLGSAAFDARRREIWRRLTAAEPIGGSGGALFVPVLDGRVVGFGHAGPERIAAAVSGAAVSTVEVSTAAAGSGAPMGEVYGFYLHPDAWGSGVASLLMDACTDHLGAGGFTDACLWVLRDNGRARAFYEKAGWTATDEESPWSPSDAPELTVVETRYHRSLPA